MLSAHPTIPLIVSALIVSSVVKISSVNLH